MADVAYEILDGQVQRISVARVGARQVALIQLRLPPRPPTAGETVYVVFAAGIGVGIVDVDAGRRLRAVMAGEAIDAVTSSTQQLWRARLGGARAVAWAERELDAVVGGRRWRAGAGRENALTLVEILLPGAAGATAITEGVDDPPGGAHDGVPPSARAAGTRIVERVVDDGIGTRRQSLVRALAKATARLTRRIDAMTGDLGRIQDAERAALRARLFVAQAAVTPRGAKTIEAIDWSTGEPISIVLPLDPARSAKEQIEAVFKRARRLKDGATITRARLADAIAARDALGAVASALASAPLGQPESSELESLESRARAAAPRDFRLAGPSPAPAGSPPRKVRGAHGQTPKPPYRCFVDSAGRRILVGRSGAHNDTLTFRVARPHDLWLHAKSRTGAHVVVPLDKGASCPADLLVEAAHLAAHFSEAREERVIDVQYVARRHVRKPRGSAPGLVVVDREKVIVLRREDAVTRRLLEGEVEP
jgi:NFACT protein RNA binding domain/NFACT N-terminal and middle domains